MDQQRSTIEEFGILRGDQESYDLDAYTFLIPFTGPLRDENEWISRQIRFPHDVDQWGLQDYAINNTKKVYIVFSAFLLSARADDGRKTTMRLWQMIVANWIEASNTPESLRYLGISHVVNIQVRKLLAAEWKHQIDQGKVAFGTPHHRMLTITPFNSSNTFESNAFVRSGLRVAESLSTAEKPLALNQVHLIRTPEEHNAQWHLVLEFKKGDLEQENYREKLVRKLLPMVNDKLQSMQNERPRYLG